MSVGHLEAYAAADPLYFDSPAHAPATGLEELPVLKVPSDWMQSERGLWEVARPPDAADREVGWKIHVAADHTTAAQISAVVVPFCVEHQLAFKRLISIHTVKLMSAKYAPRSASGKFFTIYPRDDAELVRICAGLHPLVQDLPGPRVLSDLAWLGGPLSIRYGPFRGRPYIDERGASGQLVRSPDGGTRPDPRGPVFTLPKGVELPAGYQTLAEGPSGVDLRRYRRLTALHFSNSGGVYRAWDSEQDRWVVLKEARPRTGFDRTGASAQERLRNESAALRRLRDLSGVPGHLNDLEIQGHHFLVQEHVDGESAYVWSGARQPLSNYSAATEPELWDYVEQVSGIIDALEAILGEMHAQGLASDDVHPGNVLISADGTVTLIDLEAAKPAEEERATSFHVAGFGSGRSTPGARDRRALDLLTLWFFLPYSRVVALDPDQLDRHVDWVRGRYPLTPSLTERLDRLAPEAANSTPRPDVSVATLTRGILQTATWDRQDRLFPGGVEAFTFGHACLGYGTPGTLWALATTGTSVPSEAVAWLAQRLASPSGYHGLYVGDAGTVWSAVQLGVPSDVVLAAAEKLAAQSPPAQNSIALWGGLAGDGLVLLDLDRRFPGSDFADRALSYAERCHEALRDSRPLPPGYFHGWSGIAHFLLHCYRHTGDNSWLGAAVTALGRDLGACVEHPRSGVRVALPDGRRIAYLGRGSGGVAAVADEILDHADVPTVEALLPGFATACSRTIVGYSGLGAGRSGMMAVLGRLLPRLSARNPAAYRDAVHAIDRHREMLALQLVASAGGLAAPGEQALRLSTDLLHGGAGVLLAVAQLERGGAFLPFFTNRGPAAPADAAGRPVDGTQEALRGGQYADH